MAGSGGQGGDARVNGGTRPYTNTLDHIVAELERLDLVLRLQVWRARRHRHDDGTGPAGFPAPDDPDNPHAAEGAEGDAFLGAPIGTPAWATVPVPTEVLGPLQATLDEREADIVRRCRDSERDGVELRLPRLAALFDLSELDVDVVLLCLAPELDRRYERLFAYLHDDVTRPLPTVELALHLLCPDLATRVAARGRFAASAPLVRHELVRLEDDGGPVPPSLLATGLRLDPRVVRFLLDDEDDEIDEDDEAHHDDVDERLRSLARLVTPSIGIGGLVFPAPFAERLHGLVDGLDGDTVLYCQGGYGVGKQSIAEACAQARRTRLLAVDGRELARRSGGEVATAARLLGREARLHRACLYVEAFDTLLAEGKEAHLAAVATLLEESADPGFLAGEAGWEPRDALHGLTFVRLEIPPPGYEERLELWRGALDAEGLGPDVDLPALANKFRLTGGQIGDAAATARSLATTAGRAVSQDDLHTACRLHSNRKLAELAQKVVPRYGWDDIVLPDDQLAQLHEVHDQMRYRAVVYEAWGFGRKLAMGKGLNVLFAGPPGTGKTMAAEVLATALGLDLYKIDLSSVVSKYIGETEKNLARIFDEARTSNAILFFDEADALFGKRTQVRDAHDRYANVEVSYLLQKMEEYEGVVVLATNLRKNMDEAFVRRLHVTIDFPMPGVDDRRRIWTQVWPDPTPRDPELDLELLAREVEVAGGAIRNIALAGAFLAAADGGVVTMHHLRHATDREYQKMGKVLTGRELRGA
jgi:SpoVK/Ycf46/Vps4 family AAA+-type ATPase